jgi:penicillin-binding protein 1C
VALFAAIPLSAAVAPLPARLTEAPSPVLAWADGQTAWMGLAADGRRRAAVDLDRLDPKLVPALLALEDARFWWHPGVDPLAIVRAAWTNARAGRVVSGASTLTMQVVRVLEPRPRTLTSKLIEVWRGLGLELRLSKREILEAWLTFAPYGGNLEGVEAASHALFGHGPESLAADEIALLLAIPQNPNRRQPRAGNGDAATAARDEVAARLHAAGALSEPLDVVRAVPVPADLSPLPRAVPHAALAWPPEGRVQTTLDAGLTRRAAQLLDRARADRLRQGIRHAAILVLDLERAEVVVALGGFADPGPADGSFLPPFFVPRSTGSALKPLIYGLSLDRGLALPERLVPDIPRTWGGWRPENYERTFDGVVRLEAALSRSLNVPFADLLARLGTPRFVGALASAGATLDTTPGHYGLSAAVGGVELSPWDLLTLYTALAGDGRVVSPSLSPRAERPEGLPLLSPGAAWLTRRALRLRDRPDLPLRADLSGLSPQVAWKTGTSQGHRDAWAVGFDDRHLAVVWMGNLDREPSFHLVGASAAGEVLFDLLEALGGPPVPDPAPPDLTEITVCALSGHVPGPACPRRARALAPAATVPSDPCPYHVTVEVDAATGLTVTPDCRGDRPTRTIDVLRWPAAVRRWLHDAGGDLPEQPGYAPGCAPPPDAAPRIVQPEARATLLLTPGLTPEQQQVPLEAHSARPDEPLTWFVDGALLGTAAPGERLWWTPSRGAHALVVVDGAGRASHREVVVR